MTRLFLSLPLIALAGCGSASAPPPTPRPTVDPLRATFFAAMGSLSDRVAQIVAGDTWVINNAAKANDRSTMQSGFQDAGTSLTEVSLRMRALAAPRAYGTLKTQTADAVLIYAQAMIHCAQGLQQNDNTLYYAGVASEKIASNEYESDLAALRNRVHG